MRTSFLFFPLIFTFPIPLYFDLYSFSLISIDPREMYVGAVGGATIFPVPLCLITFPILIASLVFLSNRFSSLPLITLPYLSLIRHPSYILLVLYLLLCSRFEFFGLIKGIQLLFPFLLAPLFPRFNLSLRSGIFFTKVYLYSVASFIALHLASYFFYTQYLGADSIIRFAAFWDFSIYSAHVSWSSYLGVLLAFVVLFYLVNKISLLEFLSFFIIVVLELILSTRRDPFVAFAAFISILIFFIIWRATASMHLSRPALLLGLSFTFVSPVIIYYSKSYLFHLNRIFDLSDRFEVWEVFMMVGLDPLSFVLFGMMFPYNNLHSYPLSLLFSYGLIGLALIFFYVVSFVKRFYRLNSLSLSSQKFNGFSLRILTLAILFAVIPSNLVNVSLSQPFYLFNLGFLFLIFQSLTASRQSLLVPLFPDS